MRPASAPPCRRGCNWAGCPFTAQSIPPIPGCRNGHRALTAPYACLCEHQLAGRGRRGRVWEDGTGRDLCLSLLWRFGAGEARAQGLSLGVGVAVARALESTGASGIGLKWPNDIVWQDWKLGGILIEGSVSGRDWVVVIGVGVNVHPAVEPDLRVPRVHLATLPGARRLQKSSRGESHRGDLGGMRALRDAGGGSRHRGMEAARCDARTCGTGSPAWRGGRRYRSRGG